ncbi:MAG: glycosyltransferase [Hyphomicrobiales bacterium]|nr:glycosyltransferase [Hyphomicrobiales bacterium]MBV8824702.1 glycosyltransferase [Hyphomicrobiales bacterium]MBV9427820.1 glycosyltransferase [Bradyrhizobiaceae bacterium]
MLSVIIATDESERALVATLAALVPGATAGAIREVIVADKGSRDQTAEVADVAGCRLLVTPAPLAGRLRAAAAVARARWLMFLRPGIAPDLTWIPEVMRFVEETELAGESRPRTAVFSRDLSQAAKPLGRLQNFLRRRPQPEQGLLVAKRLYDSVGGHRDGVADCEADLLRRLGRKRITVLRTPAIMID